MKLVTGILAAILLILNVADASSAVRITNDRGGRIGSYVIKYQRLASAGESVIIDGLCASACTIVLSEVPHDKICVTSRPRSASTPLGITAPTGVPLPIRKQL